MFGLLSILYLCICNMRKVCAKYVQDESMVCTRCVEGVRKMCASFTSIKSVFVTIFLFFFNKWVQGPSRLA